MLRSSLVVLLFIALAVAGAAYWFGGRELASDSAVAIGVESASNLIPAEVTAEPSASLPVPRPPEPRQTTAELAWRDGRVILPPGMSNDERITVRARSRPQLTGQDREKVRLEVSEVAADGSFRIGFEPRASRASLTIEARYCFLEQAVELDLLDESTPIRLAPALGARLTGRIVAPGSENDRFEGISVTLIGEGSLASRRAVLDVDRFEFTALRPTENHALLVKSPRHLVIDTEELDLRPGEARELVLNLRAGVVLAGRITDPRGAPLESAHVTASSLNINRKRLGSSEGYTTQDGRFRLPPLPEGHLRIVAVGVEHLTEELDLGLRSDGARIQDVLLRLQPGYSIEGRVHWEDDRPLWTYLLHAYVEQEESSRRGPDKSVVVEANGGFRLSGLENGTYTLVAREVVDEAEDYEPASAELKGVPAGTTGWELLLEGGPSLRGQVVDEHGAALTQFRIFARHRSDHTQNIRRSFEPADGRFALPELDDGDWSLLVEAAGYVMQEPVTVSLPEGDQGLVLVVQKEGRVSGVVLTPAGKAVPHARVELRRRGKAPRAVAKPRRDRTDLKGRFSFGAVAPGALRLVVTAGGYEAGRSLDFDLAPGAWRKDLELQVEAKD